MKRDSRAEPRSTRRSALVLGLQGAGWLACLSVGSAHAQTAAAWPSKPVTIVVNVAPGSSVDVVARAVAAPLQEALGHAFVIDNRSGVAGNIGAEAVIKAVPDGHTLLVSPASTMTVNPFVYPQMKWDPFKDLIPVAAGARTIALLVTRPGLGPNTVEEFIAFAKAQATPLTYASPGSGSVPHLAGEIFKAQTGIAATHVPYRGAAPALQDVLAGMVDFVFDPGLAIPHIRAGKLKLLAVAMPKRSVLFPNTPTLDEAGYKGLDASTIHGFFAPAGTPAAVVTRLNAEVNRILAQPAVREQLMSIGAEPVPMSPAQYRTLLEAEAKRYGAVVKERRINAD
ncbi:Bug family tripartite tricarboxylate transporter substrate binding protein [Aquabacterium sp.]|uniref:Bug family tripartite tricarboxylate transporter substrate binding protein n=1 Tax=Aquabacterium sp. TaxID=1872578 RepID=UPI002C72B1C2|nr:tripartite tricarboxylate transporter substrate binding protein [Aquabacterium sp.]HSW04838.1 tripartite tricarboxylate transporter substrate binding protein [Aquabacterium sp.]